MTVARSLVWIAGVAGLLAGYSLASHRRFERERRALAAKPEPLQTWEGEGGAVPLRSGRTAQQVTPSAANDVASDLPAAAQEVGDGPDYEQGRQPH